MTSDGEKSAKRRTAAQRASDANRENQMEINAQLGRHAAAPRDPAASRLAYEARHARPSHRR